MDDDSRNRANDEGNEEPEVYKIATSENRRDFVRKVAKGVAVGTAVVAAGNCKKDDDGSPTKPSANTSSTTTTSAPGSTKWTLSGYVTDADSGKGVRDAKVIVLDGPNKDRSTTTDGNGYFSMGQLEQSGFTIRISHPNYFNLERGVNLVSDVRVDLSFRPTTSVSSSSSSPTTTTPSSHYWYPC